MDFNQVRYFLALADTLNFTRAAEQSNVSQPALTQAIKRLEAELGGELIHRDGRHTELTELGKKLRGHFEHIEHTRHLVRTTAKAIAKSGNTELNIGIMCTIGPQAIAQMLNLFKQQHPTVSLVLHDIAPASINNLLLTGALDGVFCSRQGPTHPKLHYHHLFEEAMVVAFPTGHAFGKMNEVPLRAIAEQPYIDRLHCEFRGSFIDILSSDNLELNIAIQSQREDWIQSLIHDGAGVSIIPRYSLLRPEPDYRHISDPMLSRNVEFAVVNQTTFTPALDNFIQHTINHPWVANS